MAQVSQEVRQAISRLEYRSNRRALKGFGDEAGYREVRSCLQERANGLGRKAEKWSTGLVSGLFKYHWRKLHAKAADCLVSAASLQHRKAIAASNLQEAALHSRKAGMHERAGEQEMLTGQNLEESAESERCRSKVDCCKLYGFAVERYGQALKDFGAARSPDGVRRASAALERVKQRIELAKTAAGPGTSPDAWPQVPIDCNSPAIVVRDVKEK